MGVQGIWLVWGFGCMYVEFFRKGFLEDGVFELRFEGVIREEGEFQRGIQEEKEEVEGVWGGGRGWVECDKQLWGDLSQGGGQSFGE